MNDSIKYIFTELNESTSWVNRFMSGIGVIPGAPAQSMLLSDQFPGILESALTGGFVGGYVPDFVGENFRAEFENAYLEERRSTFRSGLSGPRGKKAALEAALNRVADSWGFSQFSRTGSFEEAPNFLMTNNGLVEVGLARYPFEKYFGGASRDVLEAHLRKMTDTEGRPGIRSADSWEQIEAALQENRILLHADPDSNPAAPVWEIGLMEKDGTERSLGWFKYEGEADMDEVARQAMNSDAGLFELMDRGVKPETLPEVQWLRMKAWYNKMKNRLNPAEMFESGGRAGVRGNVPEDIEARGDSGFLGSN